MYLLLYLNRCVVNWRNTLVEERIARMMQSFSMDSYVEGEKQSAICKLLFRCSA